MKKLSIILIVLLASTFFFILPVPSNSRLVSPDYFTFVDREDPVTGELTGLVTPSYLFYADEQATNQLPRPEKHLYSTDHCTALDVHGDSDKKLDIIFVATHFYPETGAGSKFAQDVNLMMQKFYNFPQFAENIDKINFYRVDDINQNDECYEVSQNPVCRNKEKLKAMASQCPGYNPANNDQIIVLFNGDVAPFAAAIAQKGFAYMPSNKHLFMIHEFGHSFAGLGDEYDKHVPAGVEPQYPNCASLTPGYTCTEKWGDLMGTGGVSCRSSCGYNNWYRPTYNGSVMRDEMVYHFCPVSKRVVDKFLSIYRERAVKSPWPEIIE